MKKTSIAGKYITALKRLCKGKSKEPKKSMTYPLVSEYIDAILKAADNLDKLSGLTPVMQSLEIPVYSVGSYAVVFMMTDKDWHQFALKCFTDERIGRDEADRLIAEELNGIESKDISTVTLYENELFVDSSVSDKTKFPVLLIDRIGGNMNIYLTNDYQDKELCKVVDKELFSYDWDETGAKYSKNGKRLLRVKDDFKGSFKIKECTIAICDNAFYHCHELTSITIPSSVISIGISAFSECINLKSIAIPSGVKSIKEFAFDSCTRLMNITIPLGVTSIGKLAFNDCWELTSITIPPGVTTIYKATFMRCKGLTSITIPQGVEFIGKGAFIGCTGLTSITILSSGTDICYDAFEDCTSLKSIFIPSGSTEDFIWRLPKHLHGKLIEINKVDTN